MFVYLKNLHVSCNCVVYIVIWVKLITRLTDWQMLSTEFLELISEYDFRKMSR